MSEQDNTQALNPEFQVYRALMQANKQLRRQAAAGRVLAAWVRHNIDPEYLSEDWPGDLQDAQAVFGEDSHE